MSGKKLSIILITITLALGIGFAAFATDHSDDREYNHHYGCDYDDGGHMNGAHYGYMGSSHNNRHDYMNPYMDDHMMRHMDED
jgi:hypothetical protein